MSTPTHTPKHQRHQKPQERQTPHHLTKTLIRTLSHRVTLLHHRGCVFSCALNAPERCPRVVAPRWRERLASGSVSTEGETSTSGGFAASASSERMASASTETTSPALTEGKASASTEFMSSVSTERTSSVLAEDVEFSSVRDSVDHRGRDGRVEVKEEGEEFRRSLCEFAEQREVEKTKESEMERMRRKAVEEWRVEEEGGWVSEEGWRVREDKGKWWQRMRRRASSKLF